jgi:hypothetical protein
MNKSYIIDIIFVIGLIVLGLWFVTSILTDFGSGNQYPANYPEVPERAN